VSLNVRVAMPRPVAIRPGNQARALKSKLRSCRILKYASGMTSTRWRPAAHRADGRMFCPRNRRRRCFAAPPRYSGVLNKGLGCDRSPVDCAAARTGVDHRALAKRFPKADMGKQLLDERAGGPNAAHPDTQTVSNPYLRPAIFYGKPVAGKARKPGIAGRR
jgi:hypothetical protein